jgi:putative Mn2+ efflux pump MntP
VSTWELFVIAVGLSMDAFAVSIGKGLSVPEAKPSQAVAVGVWFGGFQAGMPVLGFLLGSQFGSLITSYDHWIAFALLVLIGAKMIAESRGRHERVDPSCAARAMFPLAIATSIDALAVGVSFAFLKVDIVPAVAFIGVTTLVVSVVGLKLGNVLGTRSKSRAELFGGLILIAIGAKILLEHLGVLG